MCGRVFVKSSIEELLETFAGTARQTAEGRVNDLPRYNGAPGQFYPLIVREPDMPGGMFVRARWGFIPRWMKDPKGGPRPINAMSETVAAKAMFRSAYRSRRALVPIDGFFEWRAIAGEKAKQPYAIAMKDGSPFALAAIWESWRDPETGDDVRTFAVLTCAANDIVGEIHHRMPVIIPPSGYQRWIGDFEPDPNDLLVPYPSELMTIWPISRRVNSPANDDPSVLDPLPPSS